MKLKAYMKWAIAAAAAVTTVAASVSIANAYTITRDTNSGAEHEIFGDAYNAHFKIDQGNEALKQAVRFELSIDNKDYYKNENGFTYPAECTITYGGFDESGSRVNFGVFEKNAAYNGIVEGAMTAEQMAGGKFWLKLERNSYSSIEFKNIAFYDSGDNCIFYGCAQDLVWDDSSVGQWTFYQLNAPEIDVDAIQNDDGTYALKAEVSLDTPIEMMSVKASHSASEDICTYDENDIVTEYTKDNAAVSGTDVLVYNADEGADNEYVYAARYSVEITDTKNGGTVTLYSPVHEKTVKMDKLKINGGAPVISAAPKIAAGAFRSSDELLEWLNSAEADAGSIDVQGALSDDYTDSSVNASLPGFRRVRVPELDAAGVPTGKYVTGKAVYESVSGFDPDSRLAQTVTLTAHAEFNDVVFQSGFDRRFTTTVTYADYLDSIAVSAGTKTEYKCLEELDLAGGNITLTYVSGDTETIKMTDPRVAVTGFYGNNGELPEANTQRTLTVTYTAAQNEFDPARSEGDRFTCTFTVNIGDYPEVNAPVISPRGGSFKSSQKVTITAESGADIYYTTDGSEPTTASTKYTAEFTVENTCTVKAIAVKNNKVSGVASAKFTKRSSGGNPSGPGRPTVYTEAKVYIDNVLMTWNEGVSYVKGTKSGIVAIDLNGETEVPKNFIMAIAEKKINARFANGSSICGWYVKGSEITVSKAADLTIVKTMSLKHDGLRGIEGAQFRTNIVGIPASVEIAFSRENAGQFANIYKSIGGKLVFDSCARIGADGRVITAVGEQGEYVAMLCEFSGLIGDMNNDGVLNSKDASAILKEVVGLEKGANSAMADFDGNEAVNANDAVAILKKIVGLA